MKRAVLYTIFVVMFFVFLSAAECNSEASGVSAKYCSDTCYDQQTDTTYGVAIRGVAAYLGSDDSGLDKGCHLYWQSIRGEWDEDANEFKAGTTITHEGSDSDTSNGDDYWIYKTRSVSFVESDTNIADFDPEIVYSLLYDSEFSVYRDADEVVAAYIHKIKPCAVTEEVELYLSCYQKWTYAECAHDGGTGHAEAGKGSIICLISGGDCRDDINWDLLPGDWRNLVDYAYDLKES